MDPQSTHTADRPAGGRPRPRRSPDRAAASDPEPCTACHPERGEQFEPGPPSLVWPATKALPPTHRPPEEELSPVVQRRLNQDFVADCEQASRPADVGKECARFRGERNGMLVYDVGATFAVYTRLIILQRAA